MLLDKKITKPIFWLTALTILFVCLFGKLSLWQWHRYHLKKNWQTTIAQQLHAPPISFSKLLTNPHTSSDIPFFTNVVLSGHYLPTQFLLDNKTHQSQIGFDVITPFQLKDGEVILIDRGFVAADAHRQLHTTIQPPEYFLTLTGLLTRPAKYFVLGPIVEPGNGWPYKIMRIDPQTLMTYLQKPLLPYVILLSPSAPYGFVRAWTPPPLFAERSLGYCFQWLAFAIVLIIIYIIMVKKYVASQK